MSYVREGAEAKIYLKWHWRWQNTKRSTQTEICFESWTSPVLYNQFVSWYPEYGL
jgi:hypothetical protein